MFYNPFNWNNRFAIFCKFPILILRDYVTYIHKKSSGLIKVFIPVMAIHNNKMFFFICDRCGMMLRIQKKIKFKNHDQKIYISIYEF